jgi:hypothetical protein
MDPWLDRSHRTNTRKISKTTRKADDSSDTKKKYAIIFYLDAHVVIEDLLVAMGGNLGPLGIEGLEPRISCGKHRLRVNRKIRVQFAIEIIRPLLEKTADRSEKLLGTGKTLPIACLGDLDNRLMSGIGSENAALLCMIIHINLFGME